MRKAFLSAVLLGTAFLVSACGNRTDSIEVGTSGTGIFVETESYRVTEDGEQKEYEYEYDEYGSVTRVKNFTADGTLYSETSYDYIRDEEGRITQTDIHFPDSESVSLDTYDEEGNLASSVQYLDGAFISQTVYAYDPEGNVIRELTTDADGNTVSDISTDYTWENGRIVREETEISGESGRITIAGYEYDADGNLLIRTSGSIQNGEDVWTSETRYTYDERGFKISAEVIIGENVEKRTEYENDADGNSIRITDYDGDGLKTAERRVVYRKIGIATK